MPSRFMRTVRVAFGGRCLAAKSREPIASSVPADFARRFKRLRSLFASSRRKLYLLAEYFAPSARPLARRPNESHLILRSGRRRGGPPVFNASGWLPAPEKLQPSTLESV